jgi:hypothetical protein
MHLAAAILRDLRLNAVVRHAGQRDSTGGPPAATRGVVAAI